jgi:hypothetical protein
MLAACGEVRKCIENWKGKWSHFASRYRLAMLVIEIIDVEGRTMTAKS